MIVKTANFGRHKPAQAFVRNARAVFLSKRGIIGCQEIDEADEPDEHGLLRRLVSSVYRFLGWSTHVPVAVPRGMYRVVRADIIPASAGVPKQSPARQLVEVELKHRFRKSLPSFVIINVHFPRKARVLADERRQVANALSRRLHHHYSHKRTVFVTTDANGWPMLETHPAARRIAGKGIDWVLLVEAPGGVQARLKTSGVTPMDIDGHDCHWAKVSLSRPH